MASKKLAHARTLAIKTGAKVRAIKATSARNSKTSAIKTSATKTGAAKTGATKTGVTKTSATKTSATKTGAAKTSATKTGATKTGATKTGAAKTGVTKTRVTKIGAAETKIKARRNAPADAEAIRERLACAIPKPVCELHFRSPFELLIATILSAQSTDRTVNAVMPGLLARFPNALALAAADQEELESLIKPTGFFRNKSKSIRGAAQRLVEHHGGEVPRTLEALTELPGVARKTANVVLGTAYRIASGFVVDTHVARVSQRLGLTGETDPVRIEQDLCRLFPRDAWIDFGHRFLLHGRYTCLAKRPLCEECPLNELCPSRSAAPLGPWEARAAHERERVERALG